MKSFIMGVFMLSITAGNLLTAWVNDLISQQKSAGSSFLDGANYYWFFTGVMASAAVLFVVWSQFYRGQTFIQREEPA
jgi:POT family proton-dependent oligopeptide transporter